MASNSTRPLIKTTQEWNCDYMYTFKTNTNKYKISRTSCLFVVNKAKIRKC